MYKKYFSILIFICLIACSFNNEGVKTGTFKLYEEGVFIGYIYRLEDYQVESYKDHTLFANLDWKNDSTFIVKGIDEVKSSIDSLNFLVSHKKLSKNKYEIIAIPINTDLKYKYSAILEKESSKVIRFLDTLRSLNLILK